MEEFITGTLVWWDGDRRVGADFKPGVTDVGSGLSVLLQQEATAAGLKLSVTVTAQQERLLSSLTLRMQQAVAPTDKIFLNGYQSWTESRLYAPDERIPPLRAPLEKLVSTTGDYTFYKNPHQPGEFHAWSITSLQDATGATTYWIDTVPAEGYGLFEWRCAEGKLLIGKEVGGRRLQGEALLLAVDVWREAGTEVTRTQLGARPARPVAAPVSGWTSWYNYYTKIDEGIILENLRAYGYRELPIDFFQIDDGWQPAVGDWMTANAKFPQGMAFIADQIHRYGYKAGLWLAPLIVEKESAIYQTHRDWLLTHDGERLVEAGYNPGWGGVLGGTYYVLDLDLPAVQRHLRAVFDRVLNEWGYDLVKLDFLFAAGLVPANGQSRGQRMHAAVAFLRECCGDKLILGCGVPLAAAWGMADYCRIGPDIGLSWELGIAKAIHLRERISTHNALGNAIHRRHFSRCFGNDPDVFILRSNNNDLSPLQRQTLLLINHIFGDLLFTSDDIGGYDAATMRLYRSTFPLRQRRVTHVEQADAVYKIAFEIEDRRYFAAANLSRLDARIDLPSQQMYRNGEGFVDGQSPIYLKPFETRVYLELPTTELGIVGSDLHIFPGCEVASLSEEAAGVHVALHPQVSVSGTLVLRVRQAGEAVLVNGVRKPIFQHGGIAMVILDVQDGRLV